jgi:hypothetical protein
MSPEATACAGSWRPVPHLEPGDGVVCDVCKRQVYMRPAPLDLSSGPWPGEKHPRIEPHPSDAKAAGAPFEVPWSEG